MVLGARVELAHPYGRWILSPLRLPIPPSEQCSEGLRTFPRPDDNNIPPTPKIINDENFQNFEQLVNLFLVGPSDNKVVSFLLTILRGTLKFLPINL